MKILQLAPQFPFPEYNGGRIGIASTFKQLSKNADITLFTFSDVEIEEKYIKEAEKFGKIIIYGHSTKNTKIRILKSIFEKTALYLSKHYSDEIYDYIFKLCEKEKFDIVHIDHTAMAFYALRLRINFGIPIGLRLHNVEYLIWERYYKELAFYKPHKWYIKLQAERLKRDEASLMGFMNVNFPITNDDATKAKAISPKANFKVAGPGINLENWNPNRNPESNCNLLHATTYDWRHNVNAILWFLTNVMPNVKNKIPEITLTLLGKNPPKKFFNYKELGVNVEGFVPDVKPYFNNSNIFISPLFVGGGIRIKILEAMAMKLPVVATSIAAEGINASREDGLIIANNPKDFENEIIYLIQNTNIARQLGENARKFVLENYTWEKSIGIIYETYKKLIEN